MATDLSDLIRNGLSSTLESLLAKDAKLKQTNKTHELDLSGQCVEVSTNFKFESFESSWTFFIPALSATCILNLMMGEEDPVSSEEVDEDTLDALNEVVSNISGGLSTAINGSGFEDLGAVQFSLNDNKIVDGNEYATNDNLYRFEITLENNTVLFFIQFDEAIIPYIEAIANSEITPQEEIVENDEVKEEDTSDNKEEPTKELSKQPKEEETEAETTIVDEDSKEDKEDKEVKTTKLAFLKKLNFLKTDDPLKKIIIIVGALFGLVILTGIILYFTGAFEPEAIEKPKDINTTKIQTEEVTIKSIPIKKYITFNLSQINTKRLNKKLSLLTKYEILEEDAIEKLKAQEKERFYQEQQKKLEQFAKNNKEEPLFQKTKDGQQIVHKNYFNKDGINSDTNSTINTNTQKDIVFNNFIQIPTLKLQKFTKFIKAAKKVSANLSICKDTNGRTQIFIGPFVSENSRDKIIKTLKKSLSKNVKKLDLSKDDFHKMCKF